MSTNFNYYSNGFSSFEIEPNSKKSFNIAALIEELELFINENECNDLTINLEKFNFMEASQIGTLAATYHFIKYIKGKVNIIVKDRETKNTMQIMNLSNANVIAANEAILSYQIA